MRKLIGKLIEWFLSYSHIVVYALDENGQKPFHKYKGDAGYDLYCSQDVIIPNKRSVIVPTGIRIQSDDPIWFNIKTRSSVMRNKGLQVTEAVIDNDYTGEMFISVFNPSSHDKVVSKGERLAQVIPMRLIPCTFKEGVIKERTRGDRGFGSTNNG